MANSQVATASKMSLTQANSLAEQLILANSVEAIQKINTGTGTYNPANNPVITIVPRMAGFIKGIYLKVTASITNTAASGGASLNMTPFGAPNLFSSVIFTDPNTQIRINTDGYHLGLLNAARFGNPLGSVKMLMNAESGYGNTVELVNYPPTIAAGATFNIQYFMYIPFAYSDKDLRGAIYGNVINTACSIQLGVNPQAISSSTTLQPYSVYYGSTGTINSISIEAWQVYLLDLPAYSPSFPKECNDNGTLIPPLDVATWYQLYKSYPQLQLAAGAKSQLAYAPQRSYLSTFLVYNNGNELNPGTDITEFLIEQANTFKFLQASPEMLSLMNANRYNFNFPPATYYINRRHSPINTSNYGNVTLTVEPSLVNAGAQIIQYDEFFSYSGITNTAQSIGTGA